MKHTFAGNNDSAPQRSDVQLGCMDVIGVSAVGAGVWPAQSCVATESGATSVL